MENRSIAKDVLINIDECSFEVVNAELKKNLAIKITQSERNLYYEWLLMFSVDKKMKKSKTRIDNDVVWLDFHLMENEIQQNEKMIMQLKKYFTEFTCDVSLGIEESLNDTNKINIDNNIADNLEADRNNAESHSMPASFQKNTNDNKLSLSRKLECTSYAYFFNLSQKYNIHFLSEWIQTTNFKLWYNSYNKTIAYLSEYSTKVHDVLIHYENGDVYNGKFIKNIVYFAH